MKIRDKIGPRTLPWGIPLLTLAFEELLPSTNTVCIMSETNSLHQDNMSV